MQVWRIAVIEKTQSIMSSLYRQNLMTSQSSSLLFLCVMEPLILSSSSAFGYAVVGFLTGVLFLILFICICIVACPHWICALFSILLGWMQRKCANLCTPWTKGEFPRKDSTVSFWFFLQRPVHCTSSPEIFSLFTPLIDQVILQKSLNTRKTHQAVIPIRVPDSLTLNARFLCCRHLEKQFGSKVIRQERLYQPLRILLLLSLDIAVRLAPEEESNRLTGFEHNAVTPIGMRTDIPVSPE